MQHTAAVANEAGKEKKSGKGREGKGPTRFMVDEMID
jgi:hypothetical protein